MLRVETSCKSQFNNFNNINHNNTDSNNNTNNNINSTTTNNNNQIKKEREEKHKLKTNRKLKLLDYYNKYTEQPVPVYYNSSIEHLQF